MRLFATRIAATLIPVFVAACDDATAPEQNPAFRLEVSGEQFVVEVITQEQVEELEARMAAGVTGVVNGEIAAGHGGFNQPWSWHMVPSTVHTADASIELCDGRPSLVEADLAYWLDTVRRFCPWGARVVERVR
ncbi:MAG TPA: hypothetical protein VLA36_06735 [Longimicrobiales bacterium]|nr:hypothetical protein [Longimicrobiales bacterium]